MLHELFLTRRQKTKIRNAFANNMSTDISKTQISKIIQSHGYLGYWFGNLRREALKNIGIPLARDNLLGLMSNSTSNAINEFGKKVEKELPEQENDLTLFILNEDVNDIIKIIKSLEDSGVLINRVTETVKHKMKKEEDILASLVASIVQPVISSLVKGISGRGVRRAEEDIWIKIFSFIPSLKTILKIRVIWMTNLDLMAFFQQANYQK